MSFYVKGSNLTVRFGGFDGACQVCGTPDAPSEAPTPDGPVPACVGCADAVKAGDDR